MARIFSTTSTASQPQMTLDALMQRQRDLARSAPTPNREMISPWQGAAYLGETLANVVQQRRNDAALAEGRQGLASAMSGVSMEEGPTADQIAQVSQYDPDLGMQLWKMSADAVQARRQREQELADVASQRDWQRQQTTEGRIYEAGQEARIDTREEQQRIAAEKRAAAAASAKPMSAEGEIVRDFNAGLYGDPTSPEAMATRDKALSTARGGTRGTATDRKALWDQQDAYINSSSAVGNLRRAEELLSQGIDTGFLAGARTAMGQNETPGGSILGADKELATRTKEYNDLMTAEAVTAMSQALKGATTDTEMARFIEIMNDPLAHPDVKRQHLSRMLAKANAFLELQRARIAEMGGEAPQVTTPSAPDASARLLEEARQAIAKGAPAELVKKRLMEKGVDPGGL